jgi:hypothetical protein
MMLITPFTEIAGFWLIVAAMAILIIYLVRKDKREEATKITIEIRNIEAKYLPPSVKKSPCELCGGNGFYGNEWNERYIKTCSFCGGKGYFLDPIQVERLPPSGNYRT